MAENSEEKSPLAKLTIDTKDLLGLGAIAKEVLALFSKFLGPTTVRKMAEARAHEAKVMADAVFHARERLGHADFSHDGLCFTTPPQVATDSKPNDVLGRATERLVLEAIKEQSNIETIVYKTLQQLENQKILPKKTVNEDWMWKFFREACFVSDEEMQTLWAKILTREVQEPGTYSKRTIECVGLMEKNDALAFENLCKFNCIHDKLQPFIENLDDNIYFSHGITDDVLLHLATLGLITLGRVQRFHKDVPQQISINYHSTTLHLTFRDAKNNKFDIGRVLFAQIGSELAQICSSESIPEFVPYLIEKWTAKGIKVELEK